MSARAVTGMSAPPYRTPATGGAAGRLRRLVGSFFLLTAGVHVGIVAADPQLYRDFALGSPLPFVRTAWAEVFMAHPGAWGLALALGEAALAVMLLLGGRWALPGWAGVVGFHVGLMLFGWGLWLWSLPALAVLVPAALADLRGSVRALLPHVGQGGLS